jgi:YVTN family beta-propeller protein
MSPLRALCLAVLAGAMACSSSSSSPDRIPDHIAVSPLTVGLLPGATQQLTAVVYDASDAVLTTASVTYRSGDTTVAKVSAGGLVTAIAPGNTTITVSCSPATTVIVVTVNNPARRVVSLSLTAHEALVTGSGTAQLSAVAYDSVGDVILAPAIAYVSRDTGIVTVSGAGLVSRRGVGTTYVVAASGDGRDSMLVTALVARVAVDGAPFALGIFSATGGIVAQKDASTVQQLDLTNHQTVGSPLTVGTTPTSVAINGAGTRAYIGNQSSANVSVVNTATGAVVSTITLNGSILTVHVVPGDSLLLVGTDVGQLYLVRLATSAKADSFPVYYTNAIAMRGDTTVFANNFSNGTIAEINLRTRLVVRTLTVGGVPQGMIVSPDGQTLYLANETGSVQFWDLTTGTLATSVSLPGYGGYGLGRDPATGLLYVSTSYIGSRVHVIDPATHQIVRRIMVGGTPRRFAFTADGSVGIVANEGGWVDVIK